MDKVTYIAVNPEHLMKIHYVCGGGCGQIQNESGKCRTPLCYRLRNPLVECRCKDGKHPNLLTQNIPGGAPLPPNTTLTIQKTKKRQKG